MSEISACRICGSCYLRDVFDMGPQALASRFPKAGEADPPTAPLVLTKCHGECGLVQLKHTVSSDELYTDSYGYRSGLNEMMRSHLKTIVDDLYSYIKPGPDDIVIDIGSNDGTLLGHHSPDAVRVGIDPTGPQFKEFYADGIKLIPDFFTFDNYSKEFGERKAKCVTSISMFYDLPAPLDFMKDVAKVLADDGVWIMEQSYMPTMLDRNSYDTVCHEHLEYYTFFQIAWMCKQAGLRVLNVTLNDCNGGSFRVAIGHENSPYTSNLFAIEAIEEKEANIDLEGFVKRCADHRHQLRDLMCFLSVQKKTVYIYGASTKGNTMLQYGSIDSSLVIAAAERNPAKYGCRTPSTNIPIVSEAVVRAAKPDYMLVLPWHFREGIVEREKEYLEQGGQLIFPLPVIDIVKGSTHT
jgi:NDP-4-keto-2,6-dideoxyhexose 3-C-methyltransferase